jgi:hypothetical protein
MTDWQEISSFCNFSSFTNFTPFIACSLKKEVSKNYPVPSKMLRLLNYDSEIIKKK